MTETRVAAIDCGTNSIRLLIADLLPVESDSGQVSWELRDVKRQMRMVRLGQGVDRTGRLDPTALERTLVAADDFSLLCQKHGVEKIRFVATSATRDAENRQEFVDGIRERLGVEPEVVSGFTEASLSFAGANRTITPAGPTLVVDIGGGSTEFALGQGGEVTAAYSTNMGCVRMYERHFSNDYYSASLTAARADIQALLQDVAREVPLEQTTTLVGLAGSITTIAAHGLQLKKYDNKTIDGSCLPVSTVLDSCRAMWETPRAIRSSWSFMHPRRLEIIGAGALIWSEIIQDLVRRTYAAGIDLNTVYASEHDILDGIALSLAN